MPEAVLICGGQIRRRVTAEGPLALRDLAGLLHPGSEEFLAPTIAVAGGQPVLRENDGWSLPIAPHAIVIFVELPMGGGGGSNPLTAILAVVSIAVMAWNPGGALALGLEFAKDTFAYGLTMGLVNSAIMMGATALVGALGGFSGVPSGLSGAYDAATASPTYNINSSGNQARLYQPEPEGFGRMQITPDYIATPWVQYIENEQYGYFVYALGRGNYEVESMSFGDTVFWRASGGVDSAYDNVQVEFVPAGSPVTLFPDNVIIFIAPASDAPGKTGLVPAPEAVDPSQQATRPLCANGQFNTFTAGSFDISWERAASTNIVLGAEIMADNQDINGVLYVGDYYANAWVNVPASGSGIYSLREMRQHGDGTDSTRIQYAFFYAITTKKFFDGTVRPSVPPGNQ